MAVPSASPCPAQAAPGDCDGDLLWEGAFALSVPPWEEQGGAPGDVWKVWAAAVASCGCVTVCVCCLNCFQFQSASVPGPVKDTCLEGGMVYPPVFLGTKRYKCFKCFWPGPFSPKHTQGLYLAAFHGMMQHQRCCWVLNDSSENELVLQLGTIKWRELRQYCINDLFYSEENYLQKK